jgi:hypothetical protein
VVRHTLAYNSLTPEEAASMFADGSRASDVSGDAFDILSLDLASYAQVRARQDAESKTAARLGRPAGSARADGVVAGPSLRMPMESSVEPKTDLAAVVPDVRGMSVRGAVELFAHKGIMPVLKGQGGTVVRQSPPPGAEWSEQPGMEYVLWLEENIL